MMLVQQVPKCMSVRANALYGLRWRNEDEVSGNNRATSCLVRKAKKRRTSPTMCEEEKQENVCKDDTNRKVLPLQTDDCLNKSQTAVVVFFSLVHFSVRLHKERRLNAIRLAHLEAGTTLKVKNFHMLAYLLLVYFMLKHGSCWDIKQLLRYLM